jgi:hypothetical protein
MAGHGPEEHVDAKELRNAANRSIALVGMLLDGVAVKKGRNLRRSATAPIATGKCNSRLSSAGQHGSQ